VAARVEFFFDLSSPWTCLAFHNLPGMLERAGATAVYRPILVGGVFNAVNPAVYAAREQADNRRLTHSWKVLKDWARIAGVMRFCCALEADQAALVRFARGAFASYFDRQENLDDPAVLASVADAEGLDGAALAVAAGTDIVKARLRANTDEVIARGGYGSPTIFVDGDDMYFGNDQLPLVEAALARTLS